MIIRLEQALKWLLLLLAVLPVLLFAYLGAHSRMIHDDFSVAAVGLEYGAWDGLVHYFNRWTSAYSTIFIRLSLAQHAVALPPLVTTLIIAVGLLGLYWLLRYLFAQCRLSGPRGLFALAAACLVLAAAINAFYTPESFYWYSASIQYTVPLVSLISCLALARWTIDAAESKRRLIWGAVACGLVCFVMAGASEMFLVFQLVFLLLLAALAFAAINPPKRRALAVVAGLMLLATALGLFVQLSSPGIWNRMASDAANYRPPIRSVSQLRYLRYKLPSRASAGRRSSPASRCWLGWASFWACGRPCQWLHPRDIAQPTDFLARRRSV